MPASPFGPTKWMSTGHATKLTEEDVVLIKQALRDGVPAVELAHLFDVSKSMISRIRSGDRWAWVE
jgi:hypothetical protein